MRKLVEFRIMVTVLRENMCSLKAKDVEEDIVTETVNEVLAPN